MLLSLHYYQSSKCCFDSIKPINKYDSKYLNEKCFEKMKTIKVLYVCADCKKMFMKM